MIDQYIIIRDKHDRDRALEAIKAIRASDGVLSVEIKEYKENRSQAQNRLMWSWYKVIGDYMGCEKDEMHDVIGARFLPLVEIKAERNGEQITIVRPVSTASLKVDEMADYLRKIEALAIELDIVLPLHDEQSYFLAMGV